MSYEPYSKAPARSGIAYFGESTGQPTYKSNANFVIDTANSRLLVPNIVVGNGGTIGSTSKTDSITFGSNGDTSFVRNVTIAGDLIVNGTTTTVNSTTVTVQDPIIFIGSGAPNVDDNKDRGIAFNWYDTAARSGFFGFDDSTGRFTFIPKATIINEVASGAVGDIEANLIGNASTATILATARNFSLSGQMTSPTVSFDGSAAVVLNGTLHPTAISAQTQITVADDSGTDFLLLWDASDSGLKRINRTNLTAGLGTMSSFTVSGVGSTAQTITNNDNLIFAQGAAISFATSATDTVSGTLNAAVAGNGLTMTNQVLDVGAGNGITVAANSVAVTDGSGIIVDGNGVHANLVDYTTQTTAANARTTTASRTYAVQVDSSDKLVVNVPWTDTLTSFTISDGTNTQTISNSDTLRFQAGAAINFTVSATDTVSGTLNAAVAGVGLSMTNQVLAVDFSEFSAVAVASGDSFATLDSDGATEQRTTVSNLGAYFAGAGLVSDGGGVMAVGAGNGISVAADSISVAAGTGISVDANGIHIDLSEYVTPVAFASGDSFLVLDSDGSTEQRGTIMNLGAYLAGTNVSTSGDGKLSVTDAAIESVVFTTANFVDSTRIDFTATAGQSVTADLIANTISETYLTTSVAGNGLVGGNGTALAVGAGAGITSNANDIAVTDGSGILVNTGGVHVNLVSYATQSVAANAATTTASRTYAIQVNGSDQLVVNVPWTDTTYTAGSGLSLVGTTFHVDYLGTDNFINVATTTAADGTDFIAFHDSTDNNVKKVALSNLPVSSGVFQTANFIDSATIDFTVVPFTSVSGDVRDASITNVKVASGTLNFDRLQNGAALSVLGVTSNISRNNDSITAGTDNQVLRRSGSSVAFGAVNLASSDAVTGDLPFANLTQGSALSVLGVAGNATADVASISAATDGTVLRRSGTSVGFGTINASGIADNSITKSKLNVLFTDITNTGLSVQDTSDVIVMSAASSSASATLPDTPQNGSVMRFKRIDSNSNTTCTITGGTGQTIDGAASVQLYYQYESITLIYRASTNAWFAI